MAIPIKMPDIGTTVEVVKVVRWLKQVGEPVKRGEPLCEIETDKATQELESHAEGVLLWQAVPADSEVDAGAVIAYVGQPGESVPSAGPATPAAAPAATAAGPQEAARATAPSSQAKVSMLVRNLAKKLGVDLATVTGTGPGGEITREDVQRAQAGGGAPATAPAPTGSGPAGRTPLPPTQRAVAKRISKSWSE
ncbi:E3 binding domain-containing protein, partial [bacterium]|nr:E3 binding domain-containing protein [bacterium]